MTIVPYIRMRCCDRLPVRPDSEFAGAPKNTTRNFNGRDDIRKYRSGHRLE
jgi:hypothetical protein